MEYLEERKAIVDVMRTLVMLGLTNPKGGNASIRVGNTVLLTPSAIPKHKLKPEDIVVYDMLTGKYIGKHRASIECNAHLMIYKNISEARAALHAHTPISLALVDAGIDLNHEKTVETEYSIGRICVAGEAPPGSLELAIKVAEAAKICRTIIVPRHGVFVWASNIYDALDTIISLESMAKYYIVKRLALKNLLD